MVLLVLLGQASWSEAASTPQCEPQGAGFSYSTSNAAVRFVVRPACLGSRSEVGDLLVRYQGTRCTALTCTKLAVRPVVCRWSTRGCARTLGFSHPSIERADYQFDMTFTNSPRYHVVGAGGATVAASCVSLDVPTACTV